MELSSRHPRDKSSCCGTTPPQTCLFSSCFKSHFYQHFICINDLITTEKKKKKSTLWSLGSSHNQQTSLICLIFPYKKWKMQLWRDPRMRICTTTSPPLLPHRDKLPHVHQATKKSPKSRNNHFWMNHFSRKPSKIQKPSFPFWHSLSSRCQTRQISSHFSAHEIFFFPSWV